MSKKVIKANKLVELTYSISAENQVFEQIDVPVNYIHGQGSAMHEKIEQALQGKAEGDTVAVELLPEEGFGEINLALIFEDDIANVPDEFQQTGAVADFQNEHGDVKSFTVVNVAGGKVRFDGNHPLAGKNLLFNIKILQVRDATTDELSGVIPTGQTASMPEGEQTIN